LSYDCLIHNVVQRLTVCDTSCIVGDRGNE
jgi:hypothetical protein